MRKPAVLLWFFFCANNLAAGHTTLNTADTIAHAEKKPKMAHTRESTLVLFGSPCLPHLPLVPHVASSSFYKAT